MTKKDIEYCRNNTYTECGIVFNIQAGDDITSAVVAEWAVSYNKQDDGNVTVTSYWRQCTEITK